MSYHRVGLAEVPVGRTVLAAILSAPQSPETLDLELLRSPGCGETTEPAQVSDDAA